MMIDPESTPGFGLAGGADFAVRRRRGDSHHFRLEPRIGAALATLSRGQGATLFMTLLAAFQTLLCRYTGEEDLAVGGLTGAFVDTLVLRTSLAGDPSFLELLARARTTVLEAEAHQDLPFEQLAQEPLFQVMLTLGERMAEPPAAATQCDLSLQVSRDGDELLFTVGYAADLFDAATIDRLLGHLGTLLAGIVAAPGTRLSLLPLLTQPEREQLAAWNATEEPRPAGATLHGLFAAQAARTPDAVAVIAAEGTLTYRELDARAERLARRLAALGAGIDSRVGLFLERSPEMVVALLGVLKAGAAYVPLDPEYPAERLAGMLEDARPVAVLAQERLADRLPAGAATVLFLDGDGDRETGGHLPTTVPEEAAAYLIFTSGSTGRPKAATVPHRAIVNHMLWMQAEFPLGPADRVLQKTAFSFDASVWEFWAPLLAGATLVMARPGEQREPAALIRSLREHGVTVLQTVPSLLRALLEEGGLEDCRSLRRVFCGGEALGADLQTDFFAVQEAELINLYGPTETTVEVTFWRCERARASRPALLGGPIPNARLHVLGPRLEPCPVGVPGELFVGGAPVSRGYLGRPAETAASFPPDPFAAAPGERLYRTGDRVRRRADGLLEYLGRADGQVKVRGFRVELGEVEGALVRAGAHQAAAILRSDGSLVAYVTGDAAVAELRQALRERLPDYMVPSLVVLLPALPLTPNGKVDRRALRALPSLPGAGHEVVAPRTHHEERVAALWRDVLKVDRLGVHDNFWELGGHSLLATRLAHRVRESFGVELQVRALFEHPTLAEYAEVIAEATRRPGEETERITPRVDRGPVPVSPAQARLWFLDRLHPGTAAYNIPREIRLHGRLDEAALAAALGEIVHRHEALRTVFREHQGSPVQIVQPWAGVPLPAIDLSGLPEPARAAAAGRLARETAARPFDLRRGPMLRALLLRLAPREHALLLDVHHIATDGWSSGVLDRELAALYHRFAGGGPALPPLPIQYADFTLWQQRWLAGPEPAAQLAAWRQRLAGMPAVLELPVDHPRATTQSFRGGVEEAEIDPAVAAALAALGRRGGATFFMTLLAAFLTLLHRITGRDDLAVGAPAANRGQPELQELIGFFVNSLVLRVDLAGDPALTTALARVREAALFAYAHQELPFERLVAELAPERGLAQTPLFQVMFAVVETPPRTLDLGPDLRGEMREIHNGTAKFDLWLEMTRHGEGLTARLEYASDLFDRATAVHLLALLRVLLEGIAAAPGARLSELPLLPPAERQQVLHAWNDTATAYPRQATIPGLFEEQARLTPDAVAVVGGGEELTYAELNRRADRLAGGLLAAGLAPDEAVGLCAERSADLIAALLGILKAGGAYVPLDPSYPRERLAGMLADAGARIVVAQEGLEDALPESGARRLPLRGTLNAEGGPTARPALHPEQLAYVLFTSGSTGRPKGVAVTHRNVVRLVRDTNYLRFGPEEVFLQLAPVSFDASTLEIWGPLLNGGRLALYPPGPLDLGELGGALERYGVTTLWLTAGLFHPMVESHLEGLRPVRQLAAGGDVLAPELVRRALAGLPGLTLINGYGPTEGTTFTCCHGMCSEADLGAGSVPIGRPIANTRVYLLDAAFQPVPVGVVGQLHAAGDGLARGYAGRPDLTAERFVPDPVSGEPGARLYATGDLARWRLSGEIEFLGRADAQVKIRGFRVEPGEIEAALAGHAEVETALVTAREDVPGDKRLVAYVVPAAGSSPRPAALRAWTEERLPAYMVPAAFVLLPELPLGPTGKVDRRALPAPAWERHEAGPAAERSPVEELLAGLWADLLGVPGAASHDSFFELGGHSLLAVRLTSRVRAVLGVDVGLRTVFEHPTLAGLAAWIEAAARGGRPVAAPIAPAAVQERGAESPLSYAQQGLWLVDRFEGGGTALYNVPVVFHLTGPGLQTAALALALGEVVRRHEALRTVFRESATGEPVQVVQPFTAGALPMLPIIDLAGLPDAQGAAESLARELASRPFDLAHGPLLRGWLLRLGGEEHRLVVSMHHIVSDGWSIEILVREISELYEAFAQGLPSPLPPLPLQYADFAIWQRRWLAGEVLETELAWWREQLAGMPPALELPADRPRPARQSFRGGLRQARLEPGAGAGLAALSRRHGATLFMTLAAAFDALLLRYTGEEDLAVGSPIAGRGAAEIQGLIGFFVNTLVLRASLAGDPGFLELLARTRATALDAYAHQDLPFEQLVAALAPQRDPSRTPLFQVIFALHETPAHELRLGPALTGAMAEVPTATAKFDLYLHVSREGDELRAAAEYATDLFDAATVDRLLGHLSTLLAGIAAAPETPLSLLPLLTQPEREQLRALWSGDEPAPLPAPTLPGLFAARAARAPGALALVCGGETLTYAELDARSADLARRLRRLGVGPEVPVGVCLPRTADLVVGLLAVLRAGGFYVPLDPKYPAERLGYMLADSGCRLALTVGETAAVLPPAAVRLVRLDTPPDAAEAGLQDETGPGLPVLPQNLAYLIYTSGSTGRPKAVAIEHRSAALLTGWARRVFSPAELAGVVASTSIAFDVSVFELFAPLTSGGTVILVENALAIPTLKAPGALPAGVEARVAPMVPSAAAELLRSGGLPATVSILNLGGEALPRALAQRAYERPETGRVYNLYGPSEDTTYSTFAVIERGPGRTSPIGRPVDGTRAYVLDRRLQPVPAGVPGELYLAGGGLSRGYLGRPELTAERFLPDPLADEPGARMYKTGDLTFQRIDGELGELEYLGRIDRQVKVRGFRIELGEVEAAIAAHPGVQAVAAMVREDQPGDHRLVAYVVARSEADNEEVTPAEIRRTAQARLPEAMVPSHILLLDALPLSPNGKVDHRALPAPEALAGDGDELAAPRTHLEERLADLWRAVLNVERLGLHDSFWELGGHSLPAARLAHRVRETFGVELPLRTLFESPTLAEYAAAIAEALQGPGESAEPRIPRLGDGPAPLSYAQQRLWFLDRLQPGQAVYNLPVLFGLSGPLAADALAAALAEIARRHGVLRTTFAMDARSGEPVQVVAAPAPLPLPRVDLAALPPARRAAEAERLLAAERHRPFDLARGPLLRALLVRLAPRDHRLALNVHHIVFDGWSIGVLRRELQALYGAAVAGRPSPLPEPAIQYTDFSAWQRQWLAGGELAAQLAWWRQTLAGTPPVLDLPTDRPRPAVQSLRGGLETLPLGPELSAAVEQLGQHRGTTPFMTLLAAFQALLLRYTGQEDLWLGTPIANRARAETEDLLGFFVNTLVLRTSLAGDPSFAELLGRVRETALAAYAHQDLPFEKLVEELAPERDLSRSPLFQVMFSYDGERMAPAGLASGVTLEALDVTLDAAKFDLTLGVESGPEGLTASVEYAADLFDAATARRLLAHFHRLLAHAVDDPGARIAELPLITPAEREEILAAGGRTAAPIPGEPVHRQLEARAQAAPEALAVAWPDGSLTYGELDRRANRLAHRLRELGAGPERVVAILLERSPELVIAVLATVKAGGAWLPIDPAYPGERITTMLRDSGAVALLTAAAPLDRVPDLPLPPGQVLRMEGPEPQEESAAPPAVALDRDHLAYVIYTSGSTGTPKGTELTHGGLANLVAWHQRVYALSPADRSPLLAGLGFDASVWEMWPALATGASLHLPPPDTIPSPAALLSWLAAERITVAFLPTPLAEAVLEEARTAPPAPALRAVLTGGDRLLRRPSPDLPFALINHYGPTESTVVATSGIVTTTGTRAPDIGAAIANTRVHLLDQALRPVPVGIPGELCVAGAGLARGYRGRPDLTAERFVPDPLGEGPGERLYRTGDLARWLPGGRIEFLGRIDHQVKIRGVRIELGEIESALTAQPEIAAAAVVVREEETGDRRLVAYVVAPPGLDPAELRERLGRRLPAAMVPSAWVFLDALPLTPNGKVDRRALPAPEPMRAEREFVAPRTPIEEEVAAIWRAVLAVDRVGVHDNFWDLGGHSLLATKVLARIRDAFGVDLPLKTLFTSPTLGELTAAVGQGLLTAHAADAADLLSELDGLSEEEIRALLAAETQPTQGDALG